MADSFDLIGIATGMNRLQLRRNEEMAVIIAGCNFLRFDLDIAVEPLATRT